MYFQEIKLKKNWNFYLKPILLFGITQKQITTYTDITYFKLTLVLNYFDSKLFIGSLE